MIHVLHIGKTGGTALSAGLASLKGRGDIVFHGHDVRLWDVPIGEKVVFCVRDPVSRFVSGFNSRLRKGQPSHTIDWTPGERAAFARFSTPGRLTAGLRSSDAEERAAAIDAMNHIYHTARHLSFWLRDTDYLMCRRPDIFFLGETSKLTEDFRLLVRNLNAPESATLPSDAIGRHATPDGFETSLADEDIETVTRWYRDDFKLYDACLEIRRSILSIGQ